VLKLDNSVQTVIWLLLRQESVQSHFSSCLRSATTVAIVIYWSYVVEPPTYAGNEVSETLASHRKQFEKKIFLMCTKIISYLTVIPAHSNKEMIRGCPHPLQVLSSLWNLREYNKYFQLRGTIFVSLTWITQDFPRGRSIQQKIHASTEKHCLIFRLVFCCC